MHVNVNYKLPPLPFAYTLIHLTPIERNEKKRQEVYVHDLPFFQPLINQAHPSSNLQ